MSLVGSLEDLGLADILQIVNLARKSGVLCLRCEHGEGRIVFREGLVHAAGVKGEPGFESLLERRGLARERALEGSTLDRVEALRREVIETAIARMFEWHAGEFSFDVRDDLDPEGAGLLAAGLSPQYLTMEATRRGDERRAGGPRGEAERNAGLPEDPLAFSGEADDAGDARAVLIDAILGRVDPEGLGATAEGSRASGPAEPGRAACARAVVVDPDLAALEWLKSTLADLFERVHIFQGAEGAIARIRQYLSRGELPAVLLSDRAPMDPLSGIDSASELLRRLRIQAPRMPLLLLAEEGEPAPRAARYADALLLRPATACLLDPRGSGRVASASLALRVGLAPFARNPGAEAHAAGSQLAEVPEPPREGTDEREDLGG